MTFARKRDAIEPGVIARFTELGWHVDQEWRNPYDLLCWRYHAGRWEFMMVEVKSKVGRLTPSQSRAIEQGRPTRVVRSLADVDELCSNEGSRHEK